MKITKRKKNERRAFFQGYVFGGGTALKSTATARSRLAKRSQSWKIDVETERYLNSMKIFRRRNV